MRNITKWTEEEEKWLRDNWLEMTGRKLSEHLERTSNAIRKKAKRMGLPKKPQQNSRVWTDTELDILKQSWKNIPHTKIKEKLESDRSLSAIKNKARELGLLKFDENALSNGHNEFAIIDKVMSIDQDKIRLVPFGDIHLGHPACDEETMFKTLEKLEDSDEEYRLVLMGDLWEGQTKNSRNFQFRSKYPPQKQYENALAIFDDYSDKVLGAVVGNHEQFATNITGYQKMKDFCRELTIPFLKYSGAINLELNGISYQIVVTHGSSSGKSWGYRINSLADMSEIVPDADVYLYGHTHSRAVVTDANYKPLGEGAVKKRRTYALTGAFLDYPGTYADRKNYPPTSLGVVNIYLSSDKKQVRGYI